MRLAALGRVQDPYLVLCWPDLALCGSLAACGGCSVCLWGSGMRAALGAFWRSERNSEKSCDQSLYLAQTYV